jgi:hypothetical protein
MVYQEKNTTPNLTRQCKLLAHMVTQAGPLGKTTPVKNVEQLFQSQIPSSSTWKCLTMEQEQSTLVELVTPCSLHLLTCGLI